jgi:hypothetical protein
MNSFKHHTDLTGFAASCVLEPLSIITVHRSISVSVCTESFWFIFMSWDFSVMLHIRSKKLCILLNCYLTFLTVGMKRMKVCSEKMFVVAYFIRIHLIAK